MPPGMKILRQAQDERSVLAYRFAVLINQAQHERVVLAILAILAEAILQNPAQMVDHHTGGQLGIKESGLPGQPLTLSHYFLKLGHGERL